MAAISEESVSEFVPIPAAVRTAADHTARLLEHLSGSRKRGEIIRVKRITPNHYRVNVMAPTGFGVEVHMPGYKIIRSQFLRVDDENGVLKIVDQTRN